MAEFGHKRYPPKNVTICRAKSSKHAIDKKNYKLYILLGHCSKKHFFKFIETKTNLAALYIANIRQKKLASQKKGGPIFTKAQH